jgi:hypothetical protein
MTFHIAQCPFSRRGSYLSIFHQKKTAQTGPGLFLRTHHAARVGQRHVMELTPLVGGEPVPCRVTATPSVLTLSAKSKPGRSVRLCIADDTILLSGRGAGLRLSAVPGIGNIAQPITPTRWSVNARTSWCRFMVDVTRGSIRADCPWEPKGTPHMILDLLPDESGKLAGTVEKYHSTWVERSRPGFDEVASEASAEFAGWQKLQPPPAPSYRHAWERAAYVNWSAMIRPGGLVNRPAMLMSKVQMDNVWSWDHCFNAMALSYRAPALALDQWLVMFDRQDEHGALPDALNPCVEHFNYSKPPVHGWALKFMMTRQPRFLTPARLRQVYDPLRRWTEWWLKHRIAPGQRLPYYLHGNDSGWDNSTMFDAGAPLISPDLAAFLAMQLEALGDVAGWIGKAREAEQWAARSRQMIADLVNELWRGDHFIAKRMSDGFEVNCDSLVPLMPVLLGKRLPVEVTRSLVKRMPAFLTRWGLATELTSSPHYSDDGYWRGPIWAPPTMMAVYGLRSLGEHKLAGEIARRFCKLCAKSGFAENFDARTGAALRDTAYTWTSSVFLMLASAK